ncbi:hypothetical protein C9E89_019220 [Acinetobacter sichuanensis]|uniref:Uncharacterized protein n=1 Tax=Acinetobacter sichuanensis TaxID=2136183 RepID=A0A371YKR1_9GAMM|nr:hypothetical protein C9E89_019220 [Acinetobacter sichuanensis]
MIKNLTIIFVLDIFYIGIILFLNKIGISTFANVAIMSFILGICCYYLLNGWLYKILTFISISIIFIFLHDLFMLQVMASCYFLAITLFQFKLNRLYKLHIQ